MRKHFKLDRQGVVEVGSVVKYKDTNRKTKVAEVVAIIGTDQRERYEVICYDMRLQPIVRANGSYVKKTLTASRCKLIDKDFKFDTSNNFELGDVVCKQNASSKRFGIIVGFTHPEGLQSTSYENGYNGSDMIECVEIYKRGLEVKTGTNNKPKRFTSNKDRLVVCEVDLWNRTGPKIIHR